jgi:hypothetical protein
MKHSSRLYFCALCHTQAVICSHCDRGQIYCSDTCSKIARIKSCREAETRYQLTSRGKHKHAARQKRYRMRQKEKVTDHGSVITTHHGLLESVKNKTTEVDLVHISMQKRCCVCKKSVSPWLRACFLRYYSVKSSIDLSYLRPP